MLGINGKRSIATKPYISGRTNVLIGYRLITGIQTSTFLNFKHSFGEKVEGFPQNQLFQNMAVK
jgi:hypothetical protein